VLLVAEPVGSAPDLTTRWRVVEVDAADGSVRDTGVAGTVPFPTGTLGAEFAPDARSLVVWDRIGDAAVLVDLDDGGQVPVRSSPDVVGTLAFRALPGGGAIELGTDGQITLLGPDGTELQVLREHEGPVLDAAVSPDGTWAVSSGDALPVGELYRWTVDPETGRWSSPEALTGHRGAVIDVDIDAAGRQLVSVSGDQTAISWDMAADAGGTARLLTAPGSELLAAACAIVGRDFTDGEWNRYLPDRPYAPTCSDLL
jgi:WD40 repeat protein